MTLTVGDFFCGAGGSSCGAEQAGFRPVCAVNHWEIAALTYERNHGIRPLRDSICTVDPADLPRADVLMFSPECQSHSSARGARPRDDMSRSTALEVVRFVAALKPRAFVVENVPAMRQWPRFGEWTMALEDLGYGLNTDDHGRRGQILDASEWGVPQARRRLFVVGGRGYVPTVRSPRMRPVPVAEVLDWNLSLRPIDGRRRPLSAATMARIDAGRRDHGSEPFLVQYNGTATTQRVDEPCRTIPTRDRFALVVGDGMRFLTPQELLRVMGFPDGYRLAGNRSEQVMQAGNAVCPPCMRGILEQVA